MSNTPFTTPPSLATRWVLVFVLAVALGWLVLTSGRAQTLYPSVTYNGTTGAIQKPSSISSANLAAWVSDETGTGNLVFSNSPTLVTPVLGVASATSLTISGTAGSGFLSVPAQSTPPAAPASGYVEFADATGQRSWRRASDGFVRSWNSTLTANRTWTMPDATGDVAVVAANGLAARTASGTWAARTLTGTTGQITVTNGDGVSGNPTLSLPSTITQATTFNNSSGLTVGATNTVGILTVSDTRTIANSGQALLMLNTGDQSWSWRNANGSLLARDDTAGSYLFSIARSSGNVSVLSTTASTSTTTGALVVSGGVGVAGALNAGGDISARSASTGAAASVIAENTTVDGGTGTGSYTQFRMQGAASKFIGSLSAYGDEYADANFAGRVVLTTSSDLSNGLRLRVAGVNAVDVSNTGAATFNTSLRVNTTNGTAVDLIASATATLDFPSISAGGQQDLTITVTGASTGDVVQLGLPAAPTAGVVFNAFVSAANTVTVRASNITGSPIDPASATYRAAVTSF